MPGLEKPSGTEGYASPMVYQITYVLCITYCSGSDQQPVLILPCLTGNCLISNGWGEAGKDGWGLTGEVEKCVLWAFNVGVSAVQKNH